MYEEPSFYSSILLFIVRVNPQMRWPARIRLLFPSKDGTYDVYTPFTDGGNLTNDNLTNEGYISSKLLNTLCLSLPKPGLVVALASTKIDEVHS